jgi:hypothetical protein
MNPIKSPHELLIEQAGFAPQSPGMVNNGQQMLMDQTGVLPRFAEGGNVLSSLFPEQFQPEPQMFAQGGQVEMSPQDMLAMMMAHGQAPQHFAAGGTASADNQFEHILELAKRDPSILKKLSSRSLSLLGKAFDRLNPAFQAMAAYDAGDRGMDAAERARQGDYRGAAISGLGAIGSGVGMLPGPIPQVLSIPVTMGADYLQEHYDETDPHKSRFSLKNTTLNK